MPHDKAPQILIKQKAISHPQILNVISHGQAIISIKTHFKVRSKPKKAPRAHASHKSITPQTRSEKYSEAGSMPCREDFCERIAPDMGWLLKKKKWKRPAANVTI